MKDNWERKIERDLWERIMAGKNGKKINRKRRFLVKNKVINLAAKQHRNYTTAA